MFLKIKLKKGWQEAILNLVKESLRKTFRVLWKAINVPNTITLFRALLILPIIELYPNDRWLAFVLYLVAVISDFFDGYAARKLNQRTAFGEMVDPLVDKLINYSIVYFLFMDDYHLKIQLGIIIFLAFILTAIRSFKLSFIKKRKIGSNFFGKVKFVFEALAIICLFLGVGLWASILIYSAIFLAVFSILGHILIKEGFSLWTSIKKYFYFNKTA